MQLFAESNVVTFVGFSNLEEFFYLYRFDIKGNITLVNVLTCDLIYTGVAEMLLKVKEMKRMKKKEKNLYFRT